MPSPYSILRATSFRTSKIKIGRRNLNCNFLCNLTPTLQRCCILKLSNNIDFYKIEKKNLNGIHFFHNLLWKVLTSKMFTNAWWPTTCLPVWNYQLAVRSSGLSRVSSQIKDKTSPSWNHRWHASFNFAFRKKVEDQMPCFGRESGTYGRLSARSS